MPFFYVLIFASTCLLSVFAQEEIKAPKISFEMQKGEVLPVNGLQIPIFYLSARGLSIGETFKIAHRNAFKRTVIIFEGLYLGNKRISFKGDIIGSFRPVRIENLSPGERSEFLLMDSKETILSTVLYLPYPLEVLAADGAKLSLSYVGEFQYTCEGTNLKPNEKITIISTSGPEKGEFPFTACPHGNFIGSVNPKIIGMDTSKCNFTIKRKLHSLSLDYMCSSSSPIRTDAPFVIFTIDHLPSSEEMKEIKCCLEKSVK